MVNIRDRTDDFKDAVHRSAVSLGFDETRIAAILASFIMRKPRQRSPFIKAALKTVDSIGVLEEFMLKHKKDYVDLYHTTEQERHSIENEVLILCEKLHSVSSQFDQLRAIRYQDVINRKALRRKPRKAGKTSATEISTPSNLEEQIKQSDAQTLESNDLRSEPVRVQEQFLDDETRALQAELSGLLDAVQETETKMVGMSALNHLMSTHVLQQAQQIEYLYDQAVEATMNVELGNKELTKAIQRNSSSRTFLLLFLFVLTFSILFLDWYN
ncbi:unnamed protein product [Cuscuta europaea]|uniref:SNARE-complex protein Syntaxin-18 N-terminal domain-containing protein n=1 Tax=Cuscuta europaea TaxID=41803 RepID=A0A9P0ZH59_CUSEU|nr:unnamed protein product [Cuscuta europaea]